MDILIKSPGLHHIIEKILLFLGKESISSFRLLNQDCNKIVDRLSFYLKKLALLEDDLLTESITDWQKLAQNINDEDIEKKISLEFFKQFCRGFYKDPLELVFEEGNFNDNHKLVAFILEDSNPNSFLPLYVAIDKKEKKVVHFTPMHLAACFNFVHVARNMISNGCLANNPDVNGITPIHIAARRGHIDIVKTLMTSTDNPNVADNDGNTPIHVSASWGSTEIVETLMTTTDNPNVANNNGWTPIHAAAKEGHIKILKILMATTDNPNVADNNGLTPIRVAARGWHIEIVKTLETTTDNPSVVDNMSIIFNFSNMFVYYFILVLLYIILYFTIYITIPIYVLTVLLFGTI